MDFPKADITMCPEFASSAHDLLFVLVWFVALWKGNSQTTWCHTPSTGVAPSPLSLYTQIWTLTQVESALRLSLCLIFTQNLHFYLTDLHVGGYQLVWLTPCLSDRPLPLAPASTFMLFLSFLPVFLNLCWEDAARAHHHFHVIRRGPRPRNAPLIIPVPWDRSHLLGSPRWGWRGTNALMWSSDVLLVVRELHLLRLCFELHQKVCASSAWDVRVHGAEQESGGGGCTGTPRLLHLEVHWLYKHVST